MGIIKSLILDTKYTELETNCSNFCVRYQSAGEAIIIISIIINGKKNLVYLVPIPIQLTDSDALFSFVN